jgi:hypothetical protein
MLELVAVSLSAGVLATRLRPDEIWLIKFILPLSSVKTARPGYLRTHLAPEFADRWMGHEFGA